MIPIVFSTDHKFIMPTGVALFSLVCSGKTVLYDIFILHASDVTCEDKRQLEEIVSNSSSRITFISMADTFCDGYEVRGISHAAYYRLLIPWLIPQYDKVIYLDGDIVVCDQLNEMYDIDIETNYFAAELPYRLNKSTFADYAPTLGVLPENYVQSGVLLINCSAQRRDNLKDVIASHVGKVYKYLDQDIISIVCGNRITQLPCRYNITPEVYVQCNSMTEDSSLYTEELEKARARPCIIHYAGSKPWNQFTLGWDKWWSVYKNSPFYDPSREEQIFNTTYTPHYSIKTLLALYVRSNFPRLYELLKR